MTSDNAQLDWQDGQPYSLNYGDVYFSRDHGMQESQYVFLSQNHLQHRWQSLNSPHFTIAETGFGTGLNFLCAWQLWLESAPSPARLHYISTEKHPLTTTDLARALDLWPTLKALRDQLLIQYQSLSAGWHQLKFDQGRVTLTLLIGDAMTTLPKLYASVDAWFLDGFAPAKNPEMWQPEILKQIARLSHAETTFATFTSAAEVRRGLLATGFDVSKVAGFGRKREMLVGQYQAGKKISVHHKLHSAVVIGGGIAGTSTSRALAERGWQVTLIERHAQLAQEASGNQVGILYPRLSGQDITLSRLALNGYLNTLRLLQRLQLSPYGFAACGLLQLAFDARELARCRAVAARGLPAEIVRFVATDEASELAGITLKHSALYFPAAGWVSPPAFCMALAAHKNIEILASYNALQIQRHHESWQVYDKTKLLAEAEVVVLASANDTRSFEQSQHLPLESVRGQMTMLQQSAVSQNLRTVLCADGYISPAYQGMHGIGATFSPNDTSTEIRESDHHANISMLKHIAPGLHAALSQQPNSGRVAFRCSSPDYLPLIGPLLDGTRLLAKPPRPNASATDLPWLHGLYVNTGHGSKGLINAPLCAEMLASVINGEPAPVDAQLLAALDPNRFLLRKMGLKALVRGLAAHL